MKQIGRIFGCAFLFGAMVCASTSSALDRYRGVNVPASITAQQIQTLAGYGVNAVRFQISVYDADSETSQQYFARIDAALDNLDSLLSTFQANGIKVLLDFHTPPGGFIAETRSSSAPEFDIITDTSRQNDLISALTDAATRYQGNTTVIGIEPQSEVATGNKNKEWAALACRLADAILDVDSSREVYLTPPYANYKKLVPFIKSIKAKSCLGRAKLQRRVTVPINVFLPFDYTNQIPSGTTYKLSTLKAKFADIKREFTKAKRFARFPLTFGENGVKPWAPNAGQYLTDFTGLVEKYKIAQAFFHIFFEANVWSPLYCGADENNLELCTSESDRLTALKAWFANN